MPRIIVFLVFLKCLVLPDFSSAQAVPDSSGCSYSCGDTLQRQVAALSRGVDKAPVLKAPDMSLPLAERQLQQPAGRRNDPYAFRGKQVIAPAVFFGLGVTGVTVSKVKLWNTVVRDRFRDVRHLHFDDYLQYAPFASPYLLKLCGLKGRHNYGEYTILLATSYLSMGIMVNALKYSVKELRPDGSSRNSFPSGHTATAFMGAELLRAEYWEVSPWIGVLGYSVASMIGFMRVYNSRHWVTDVFAGAGIGILSVRIAYWTFPTLQRMFFGKNDKAKGRGKKESSSGYASIVPSYNGSQFGAAFSICF